MNSLTTEPQRSADHTTDQSEPSICWTELLNLAFTGWAPTDQMLERIIDRMEQRS